MQNNQFFFITGLPRSRTAWLSLFFTQRTSLCIHDAMRYVDSPKALRTYLEKKTKRHHKFIGVSDSSLASILPDLAGEFKFLWEDGTAARMALVQRPMDDVGAALDKVTGVGVPKGAALTNKLLRLVSRNRALPGCVPRYSFDELDSPVTMQRMQRFLLPGIPFDIERYYRLNELRVTIHEDKYKETLCLD